MADKNLQTLSKSYFTKASILGIGIVLIMPLAGCISLLPKTGKPPMLAPMLSTSDAIKFPEPLPFSIAVDLPEMPRMLSGYNIAVLQKNQSYAYIEDLRLTTPANNAIQNIIITNFEKNNSFKAVTRGNSPIRTDYELAIDVSRFDVSMPNWKTSGEAKIVASVRIIDAFTRMPIASQTFNGTANAEKGEPIMAAQALQKATDEVSIQIMNWSRDTIKDINTDKK